MKYQTPELSALTPAINAVQESADKRGIHQLDTPTTYDSFVGAYQDWE